MKLTKHQCKVLRVWLRYHSSGYGVGQWIRSCWKSWLLLGAMAAWAYIYVVPTSAGLGWAVLGLCMGAALRDIGYYQVSRRTWSVTDRVVDWKRVQEFVDSYEKPVA
jgi:hypothetical protein